MDVNWNHNHCLLILFLAISLFQVKFFSPASNHNFYSVWANLNDKKINPPCDLNECSHVAVKAGKLSSVARVARAVSQMTPEYKRKETMVLSATDKPHSYILTVSRVK